MKLVKTLTIVAVTGLVGLTALNACPSGCGQNDGAKSCKGMKEQRGQNYGDKSYKGKKQQRGQMRGMFKELDLSSEQKEKMQALRQEMKTQKQAKRSGKQGRRMGQMGQFVSANGFDKEAFTAMATM